MSTYEKANELKFVRMGWTLIIIIVFIIGGWASFAPLDQGVAVPGVVIISGQRKSIQHPTGGVVQNILVHEGQSVKAGQLLVKMSDVQIQSKFDSLSSQYFDALLEEQRLKAENSQSGTLVLNKNSKWPIPNDWQERMNLVHSLFLNRKSTLSSTVSGLESTIMGLKAQLGGLRIAEENQKKQLEIVEGQLRGARILSQDGYIPRNNILDQESKSAGIKAQLSETIGRSNQLLETVKQMKWNIRQKKMEFWNDVSTNLVQCRSKILSLDKELNSTIYELRKTKIVAPVAGTVAGLKIFTQGGVIAPAETIMFIIPSESKLEVQGRLPVNYIDRVVGGESVELLFTAFNHSPRVNGKLTMVGADRLIDEQTQPFYDIRAKVEDDSLSKSLNSKIRSGMPVEIFIRTGERSLLSYLLKPITDRAHIALTER